MFFAQYWCLFRRVPGEPADVEREGRESPGEAGKEAAAVYGGVQGGGGADALGRSRGRFDLGTAGAVESESDLSLEAGGDPPRGTTAVGLEGRVRDLEAELRRVERER